jgi:hypothetical protein
MPGLQRRGESYRLLFRYQGKQHALTLGAVSTAEAKAKAAQVDYLLLRLKQGLAVLPPGMPIVDYLATDGRALRLARPEVLSPLFNQTIHLIGGRISSGSRGCCWVG